MPKVKRKKILIAVLAVLALYVVTEIAPALVEKAVPTVTIENGRLTVEDKVKCYALRNETVYAADENCTVEYTAENGKLMKVGENVCTLEKTDGESTEESSFSELMKRAGDDSVRGNVETAGRKGVFTTFVDGYEKYFTLDNYKNITEASADEKGDMTENVKSDRAVPGQPLYKITDQSEWHLVCWIESGKVSRYREGDIVEIVFDSEAEVRFTVSSIDQEGDKWKLLLTSNRYCPGFTDFRMTEVTIVSLNDEGLKIPNGCITTKDDVVGVYVVRSDNENEFVPISIVASDGESSIVKENIYYDEEGQLVNTVRIYDEILKNPPKESEK